MGKPSVSSETANFFRPQKSAEPKLDKRINSSWESKGTPPNANKAKEQGLLKGLYSLDLFI